MSSVAWAVTAIADQAVVLPIVMAVAIVLAVAGERRAALWWGAAVGGALLAVLAAKVILIPCGPLLDPRLRSPSGHTASAAAAYGGLLVLLARLDPWPSRWGLTALGIAGLAAAVGASRLVLHMHTLPEVVIGAMLGLSAPAALAVPRPLYTGKTLARRRWLLAAPLLAGVAFLGAKANVEPTIMSSAYRLAMWLGVCS